MTAPPVDEILVEVTVPVVEVTVTTPSVEVVAPGVVPIVVEASGPPGPPGFSMAEADLRYVNIDGDSMNGPLVLNGDPQQALEAVTKQYTDARTPQTTVSTTAPPTPSIGDVWIDSN